MESWCLAFPIFVVLLSVLGGSHAHAQITDEDYWKVVWPNTAIPDPLRDLLKPAPLDPAKNDLPIKLNDTQYPIGFFFNHEIYPGKTMTIKFAMNQGYGLSWDKSDDKAFQREDTNQGYGLSWDQSDDKAFQREDMNQGYGLSWDQSDDKAFGREHYKGYTRKELCVQKGPEIENKYCAESLRTLMDYVISKLGKNAKPLLSSFVSKQDQYKVEGMTNIGDKAVMCHRLNFQKTTFYCHQVQATTVYTVPLVAGDGTKTQALAACHFDTSGINKKWIKKIMKVDPGTTPICHFLGSIEIVWVPN